MARGKKTDSANRADVGSGPYAVGMTDKWEIRKGGKVWVTSTTENCGYKEPALESLRKAGYSLYKNGVCVMKGARR